jgi:exoribonuclease-2
MSHSDAPAHRSDLREIARRAMIERDLLPDFNPAEKAEADRLREADPTPDVRDLRGRLWCSIDNDDTRDLDQLSVGERAPDGKAIRIFVAVADVDVLVPASSVLDGHASHNTTSVYTAAQVFPMLPERLSTDLTSLGEGQDRLAVVVEMTVEEDGTVSASDLYRAVVHNRAHLTYHEVAAWLEQGAPVPRAIASVPGLEELVRLQDEAACRLRTRRHERGALSFDNRQVRPVFDGDTVRDLAEEKQDRATELIEDFMIAANSATAEFLEKRKLPSLRRVVRSPKRWPRIVEIAAGLHEQLPAEPDSLALAHFLDRRRQADPLGFPELSLSVIKLLGRGEYVADFPGQVPPGHFGLATEDYTHSTAPNRRYPDLVTQRLLKAALAGAPCPYTNEQLTAIAEQCTRKEDDANRVERQVGKSAAALLLSRRIGESFDGVITGASGQGTWVRVFHPPVEGRIEHGFEGLDVGDRVRVRLVSTDVERGFIDFVRVR